MCRMCTCSLSLPVTYLIIQKIMCCSMLDLDSSMNEEGPILCQEYARVWDARDSINETQFNELVGES